MNVVTLIGRLTKDIDLRKTTAGKSVTSVTLAVDRGGRDAGADWVPVTVYDQMADNLARYCAKGNMIAVKGRLRAESKDTQQGRRFYVDVIADQIQYLEPKRRQQNESQHTSGIPQQASTQPDEGISIPDEYLPF